MLNPLLDKDFLKQLDLENQKTKYVKVIALDFDENPIEEISGVVTQGTINIDGKSAVRRTCSLTLVASEVNYSDYLWGLNTKIDLQIGIENRINDNYPDIIWFKQGVYLLTSFSITQTESSYTISLQGKDKMCLLNGDISGTLPISIDFGSVDQKNENGIVTNQKLKIVDIILGIVHTYGKESFENIFISDVEETGLELLTYKGNNSLYYLLECNSQEVKEIITDSEQKIYFSDGNKTYEKISDIPDESFYKRIYNEVWEEEVSFETTDSTPKTIDIKGKFYIVKIEPGQTSAYRDCDLVYSGDLIASAGDTITSILDKIVKQLGEYEYFYNLDGQFVFRRKKTYINTSWNNMISVSNEEEYAEDIMSLSAYSYSFDDQSMINSFNLNPGYDNLKNDYSIWGTRKNIYGNYDLPIHLRYAINSKPIYYKDYEGFNVFVSLDNEYCPEEIKYYTVVPYDDKNKPKYLKKIFMGLNYKKMNLTEEDIADYIERRKLAKTDEGNGWYNEDIILYGKDETGDFELITENTGDKRYDAYYVKQLNENWDCNIIYCDWREIIYQMAVDYNNNHLKDDFRFQIRNNNFIDKYNPVMSAPDEGYYLYPEGKTGYEQYYEDMTGFWRGLYNPASKGKDNYEAVSLDELGENTAYSTLEHTAKPMNTFNEAQFNQSAYVDNMYVLVQSTEDSTIQFYANIIDNFFLRIGKVMSEKVYNNEIKFKYKGLLLTSETPEKGELSWDNLPSQVDINDVLIRGLNEEEFHQVTNYNKKSVIYYGFSDLSSIWAIGGDIISYILEGYTWAEKTNKTIHVIRDINQFSEINNTTTGFYSNESYIVGTVDAGTGEVTTNENNIPFYTLVGHFDTLSGWNEKVWTSPEKLDFWIDFLDSPNSEINQYSVVNIGSRPKVINDSDAKGISYKEIFSVKITDNPAENKTEQDGYNVFYLGEGYINNNFQISSLSKTCQDVLDDILNNYTYCTETISITAAPIYYLEPNTLITIQQEEMRLKKKYEVSSISIPLSYNGTMSVSASRVYDTLY